LRLYFIFSGDDSVESTVPRAFSKTYDDAFAQRVLMHFTNDVNLCTGCASFCEHCRDQYPVQFAQDIVGLLQLPAQLPMYIDDPEDFLPPELEAHDVALAINVHEDLLLSLPDLVSVSGGQALIVPVDDSAWLNAGVRRQVERRCAEIGLECAFPKPACSLEAREDQPTIADFQRIYRVGKPKIVVQSRDGVIREARVVQSAPCGNTYFVAYNLAGQEIGPDLNERVVAKYWHSFPCVGSMTTDPELGDSLLHKGGYLHYQAVDDAVAEEARLKEEARERGQDPEEYVLMRRLSQFGEQPAIPNKLAELRELERRDKTGTVDERSGAATERTTTEAGEQQPDDEDDCARSMAACA
jgi:thymidylate synthase